MAGPVEYRVLRQTRWGEQTVYMVLHLQRNETLHVIDEPVGWSPLGLDHPALPRLATRHEGNGIRQSWLPLLDGERLSERRVQGGLTGVEIAAALEATAGALHHLATYRPAGVPGLVDPDCLCRMDSGEWVVDYALLAHNPEVRRSRQPVGVYAVGLLLYWFVTGEFPRLGRPALSGRFPALSTTLLLPLVKSLNESYRGMPELQQALVDCRRAGGFDRLAEYLARPVAKPTPGTTAVKRLGAAPAGVTGTQLTDGQPPGEVVPGTQNSGTEVPAPREGPQTPETQGLGTNPQGPQAPHVAQSRPWVATDPTATLVGLAGRPLAAPPPEIPLRDSSWSPAPWHEGGLPRRPRAAERHSAGQAPPWARPALIGTGAAAALLLALLAIVQPWRAGLIPPPEASPGTTPAPNQPLGPSPRLGDAARLTLREEAFLEKRWARLHKAGAQDPGAQDPTAGSPVPGDPGPSPKPVDPTPGTPDPVLPPLPAAPEPEPGSVASLDREAGGRPHLLYVNGAEAGWAWIFPVDGPYLSLGAFNDLFHRTLYWVPRPGNRVRLLNNSFVVETGDVQLIRSRLWLRLTPALQHDLGITLDRTADGRLFFHTGD